MTEIHTELAESRIAWLMQRASTALDEGRMEDAARCLRLAAHLAQRESSARPPRGANDE